MLKYRWSEPHLRICIHSIINIYKNNKLQRHFSETSRICGTIILVNPRI